MIIELHAIQSFAPNLLNRDDTGMPKDCVFGGHRRARVSSQSWKRAIRQLMRTEQGLDHAFGIRSTRLAHELAKAAGGHGLERRGRRTGRCGRTDGERIQDQGGTL